MRRLAVAVAGLGLGLVTVLVASMAWIAYDVHRAWSGWSGESVDVVIEPGLDATSMLRALERAGVVRDAATARLWLSVMGGSQVLQAGEYRFTKPASALEVIERLRQGDVLLHPVTVPEGLDRWAVAERFAVSGLAARDDLLAAFDNGEAARALDERAATLEGYLFPDTYYFPRGVTPSTIARTMVARFSAAVGEDYAQRAETAGLTLHDAVTLASLIEEETHLSDERRTISQVFHNRLRLGMKLQCDPTVIYALRQAGRSVGPLTRRDLAFDSPWNTYARRGLPPGPISSPGLDSLVAAVEPTEGRLLYFVASPDGGHVFSDSLAAHQRAVRRWRSYERSSR